MSYKVSRARKNLKNVYSDIAGRLRAAEYRSVDPKVREYVIAASIFLAHAEIENYISDLLSSFSTGLQSKVKKGSGLPDNLRSHLFL